MRFRTSMIIGWISALVAVGAAGAQYISTNESIALQGSGLGFTTTGIEVVKIKPVDLVPIQAAKQRIEQAVKDLSQAEDDFHSIYGEVKQNGCTPWVGFELRGDFAVLTHYAPTKECDSLFISLTNVNVNVNVNH